MPILIANVNLPSPLGSLSPNLFGNHTSKLLVESLCGHADDQSQSNVSSFNVIYVSLSGRCRGSGKRRERSSKALRLLKAADLRLKISVRPVPSTFCRCKQSPTQKNLKIAELCLLLPTQQQHLITQPAYQHNHGVRIWNWRSSRMLQLVSREVDINAYAKPSPSRSTT